ncbi:MarR family winged helix-turn-helix transcriptional regulator [Caballeronia cordobensis]|uniref:MarR family winged helix-turn-helix transcriptional regulator n=1 Tax=Caballeronia cordobensis TaxID=1353886 RepID=UPI001F263E13|nr:MarR family winged helix-turn-helix transcriptional regulator [Caballeronia cordobensis]
MKRGATRARRVLSTSPNRSPSRRGAHHLPDIYITLISTYYGESGSDGKHRVFRMPLLHAVPALTSHENEREMASTKARVENIDGTCTCLAARQAARYLTAAYDQALRPANLRSTQFSILYRLARNGPLTIGDLAESMAMDRTTLSANLKPLDRDGLLDMMPTADRRVRKVIITNVGLSRYRMAFPLWQAVQQEFEDGFGQKRAEALRNSLRSVLQSGFSPWSEGETAP